MIEQLWYWIDVLLTACGLDTASEATWAGVFAVVAAAVTLIFAAYRAVTATLWPREADPDHIKHRLLREEIEGDAG